MDWRVALQRARRDPGLAIKVALALLRGRYYLLKYRLLGRRVVAGRRFRVVGRLDIRGPGTVIFGDDCTVVSSRMSLTTPWTHAPDAVIRFGDRVLLTGTRISCIRSVEVEDDAGLSDARIMDTDFHSPRVGSQHRANTAGAVKPVHVGRNVWVGAGAWLLKGARIGENSVVSAASVVVGEVPPNCIVLGNPARVTWRFPQEDVSAAAATAAATAPAAPASPAAAPADTRLAAQH
jgi:maltose O-acetyltransferase